VSSSSSSSSSIKKEEKEDTRRGRASPSLKDMVDWNTHTILSHRASYTSILFHQGHTSF
jgi:hypothetical protein